MYYAYTSWLTIEMRRQAKRDSIWRSLYKEYLELIQGRDAANYMDAGNPISYCWYK